MNIEEYNLSNYSVGKHGLILAPRAEARHVINVEMALEAFSRLNYRNIIIVSNYPFKHGIFHPSNMDSLKSALEQLKDGFETDDLLTVYVTSHGYIEFSPEAYVLLQCDQPLVSSELSALLKDYFGISKRLIIADICYGYDFMLPMLESPRDVGISASANREPSEFNYFPSAFFPSLSLQGNAFQAYQHASKQTLELSKKKTFPNQGSKFVVKTEKGYEVY